ncbi:hypothetical protein M433DRAFT_151562 [Acidomyces richmondensis BFW]|nr:MAG: hypothetical protein FE78DRAFT_85553 [Acidomyces sp. 'richmondensis']KYG48049.1 hypothetical protein M433DRAFT_151562 [Acidomyces richmondensis BFW]
MDDLSPDELLSILLKNLRNAISTFGEGTPPCESIRSTIEDHIRTMQNAGSKTNITAARKALDGSQRLQGSVEKAGKSVKNQVSFENLTFRPKKK